MKKLIYLIPIFLLLFSCDEDTNPGSVNRYFYANSEVSPPNENVGMYVNWTEGQKTVFRFILIHPDEVNIADDELAEVFCIEIPSNITEFTANQDIDSEIEVYYTRSCYCGFSAFEFSEYDVIGNKLDNGTWNISFSMTAQSGSYPESYTLEDSGIYSPGQREE